MGSPVRIIGHRGYIGSALYKLSPFFYYHSPLANATILLAGHSSVAMCANHPEEAWANNVDFFRQVLSTIKPGEKFIYASSASVYDGVEDPNEDTNEFNLKGMYDLTKRTIDDLAQLSDVEFYGLRFATVNGWSPNLRTDVMLNKMYYDAITTGVINVQNGQLKRPILGIKDLDRAIQHILAGGDKRGIYNLASFAHSVEDMAQYVGLLTGAEVKVVPNDNPPYAFGIDTSKFEEAYDFTFEETLNSVTKSLVDNPFKQTGIRI